MSSSSSVLPDDLAFDESGHASDVALSALADGQVAILGAKLHAHVDGCAVCTARLGEEALLSAHVGDALFAWGRERPQAPALAAALVARAEAVSVARADAASSADPGLASRADRAVFSREADFALPRAIRPAAVRRPLPFLAIAAALVVAILCAGPSFADPTGEPRWHAWVRAPLSLAGRLTWRAARQAFHPSHTTILLQWGSSIAFALLAIVLAVSLGKSRSFQGEP